MCFPQILQNKKVVIWPLFLKCVWLYGRGTEYFTKVMSGLPGGGWGCVRAVWNWFQQSSFPKSVTPDPTPWWAREKCYTHHPLWNRLFGLALTIRRFLPALIRRVYRGVREMVAGFAGPLKAQHKPLKCAVQVHAQGCLQRILATVFIRWTILVALSPVSPLVKLANGTVSGLTSQKYPHKCLLLFVTIFSVTLFSCQSCHSVCSVWGARGWQLRHHHHLRFTEQETKARAHEWAAWFCTWWGQNLSRDLLNPLLHLFLSPKKHLHSNSIDHDTAVRIL